MKNKNHFPNTFQSARRKLQVIFAALFTGTVLILAVSYYFIMAAKQKEEFEQLGEYVQRLTDRVNYEAQLLLQTEQDRPFADYSFFVVKTNPLLDAKDLDFSPLSDISSIQRIPGCKGFFTINSENKMLSPLLPDIDIFSLVDEQSAFDESELRLRSEILFELREQFNAEALRNSAVKDYLSNDNTKLRIEQLETVPSQLIRANLTYGEDNRVVGRSLDSASTVEIEVEVSPLSLSVTPNKLFVFSRLVRLSDSHFVQGFIVQPQPFLDNLTLRSFTKELFPKGTELRFILGDQILSVHKAEGTTTDPLRFSASLSGMLSPLKAELRYSQNTFSYLYNTQGVLFLFLALTLGTGLYGMYTLSLSHIELANERGNFVSAVTHELKTPLTSIRMYAEMLLGKMAPDEQVRHEYYSYILKESERLSRLVNNVLDFSKLRQQRLPATEETNTVEELWNIAVTASKLQAKHSEVEVNIVQEISSLPDTSIRISEDAFTQIITNLVDNALKFGQGSKIEIGIKPSNTGSCSLWIRDFGLGMSPEVKERAFEAFYRGEDELTREKPGTGIGLAIVFGLCNLHGISLRLEDASPGLRVTLDV